MNAKDLVYECFERIKMALKLDTEVFQTTTMVKGFTLIILVGLVVGFFQEVDRAFEIKTVEDIQREIPSFEEIAKYNPFLRDLSKESRENIEYYINQIPVYVELGFKTAELESPVKPYLEAFGKIVSSPFGFIAFWIFYGGLVFISSKILGGEGSLETTYGATALWSSPHLLKAFVFVPVLGGIASPVAWIWGLVIYIKAIMVSQEFDVPKAILAFLLPIIAVLGFLIFVAVLFFQAIF